MSMRGGALRSGTLNLRSGLLGASLCLCAVAGWASDIVAEPSAEPDAVELQKNLQQLNTQIGQLRQTTVQTGQVQIGQGQAIQQQIGGIERQQSQLGTQLRALDQQSLQQIEALQKTNRKLVIALWTLAGIVALLLLMLVVLIWRCRQSRRLPLQAMPAPRSRSSPTPTPAMVQADKVGDSDKPTEPPPSAQPPAQPPEQTQTQATAAADLETAPATEAAPPPAASSWARLLAADLNITEQALAQARESFMQPARIDS